MVKIEAIMGDKLVGSAQDLEEEIRRVAAASRFTARETAEAAKVLALAGLTFDNLVTDKAIENLAKFAEAAGGDIEGAAGIAIAGVKAFGLEVADMDRVMDVMVKTFTSSFTTLESLGQSMKFLGPTARAAGLEIEEAAAAVGALGNAGLQGTMAGTGLRMAINKLLSPSEEARKAMDRLGLNFLTLTPAGEAAKATFQRLQGGIDSLKIEVEGTTTALRILEGQMTDLSISEQKNSLAIAQIRRRAAKENRELTKDEVAQIERLESANADLMLQHEIGFFVTSRVEAGYEV